MSLTQTLRTVLPKSFFDKTTGCTRHASNRTQLVLSELESRVSPDNVPLASLDWLTDLRQRAISDVGVYSDATPALADVTNAAQVSASTAAPAALINQTQASNLVANYAPMITIQPVAQVVAAGKSVMFTAAAKASPAAAVQWQVSTDKGKTYTVIPGATSSILTFTAQLADRGKLYRAVFTNSLGKVTSKVAALIVDVAPVVTTQPRSVTVATGKTAVFKAAASGIPAPKAQWQLSTNAGTTWRNIAKATSPTLTITNVTMAQDQTLYRAVFTNPVGVVVTNPATLSLLRAPAITLQPVARGVAAGNSVTFTATAKACPTAAVQWQVSANHGKTYTAIAGATTPTLTFTAQIVDSGKLYRAVFTNSRGTAVTKAAELTVKSTLVAGILTPPVTAPGQAIGPVAVFHFTDVDPAAQVSNYSATVRPGDGATLTNVASPEKVQVIANPGGGFDVLFSYTYSTALNDAKFAVTVQDRSGAAVSASAKFSVLSGNFSPVIRAKWLSLRGGTGFLANPISAQFVDAVTGWPRVDFQGGSIFLAPNGAVALGNTIRDKWLSMGGVSSALGLPTPPPSWATAITLGSTWDQHFTTGGHSGQVSYFQNGLIYWRDGPEIRAFDAPVVMRYDTAEMGGSTYARFKLQLLDQFTDKYGLVLVDYNQPASVIQEFAKQGIAISENTGPKTDANDSAWMTGMAVCIAAIEQDFTTTAFLLRALLKWGWNSDGNPIRHPRAFADGKTDFTVDPFTTQMAACYFAWKFASKAGNSEVQVLAKELLGKFIDLLSNYQGKLGTDSTSQRVILGGMIALQEVAKKMGLDQDRLNKINGLLNGQKAAFFAASGVLGTLSRLLGIELGLESIAAGLLSLDNPTLYALYIAIQSGWAAGDPIAPSWDGAEPENLLEVSGLHVLFWENLLMHECASSQLLNGSTRLLADATAKFSMMPFQWLAGAPSSFATCQSWVANWGFTTDLRFQGDYWWRNRDHTSPEGNWH